MGLLEGKLKNISYLKMAGEKANYMYILQPKCNFVLGVPMPALQYSSIDISLHPACT